MEDIYGMWNNVSQYLHIAPETLKAILISSSIGILAIVSGIIVHAVFTFFLKRWHRRRSEKEGAMRLEIEHLTAPLRFLFPAAILAIVLPFLVFPPRVTAVIQHATVLWVIAGFSWLAVRVLYIVRDVILGRYDIDKKDNLRARRLYTQIRVIQRVVTAVVIIIAISAMLMTFAQVRKLGVSLLASAGVIGIILGLAAQKTLGNLFTGIQIAMAQPIRLDDVVIVENEWGRIEEITLTYVVVRIWDLRRLIVPITYFVESPFQNWTRISADLLGTVFIYADYRLPVQEVRDELKRVLDASPQWDKKVWNLQVTDTTDRTMQLRALMSASDSSAAWDLRCTVREKLIDFLQKNYSEFLPRVRVEIDRGAETSNSQQ
jgi:small-conductance mechanosensitive channel